MGSAPVAGWLSRPLLWAALGLACTAELATHAGTRTLPSAADGYDVDYLRVPVTDEKAPKPSDFQLLIQAGRGRRAAAASSEPPLGGWLEWMGGVGCGPCCTAST